MTIRTSTLASAVFGAALGGACATAASRPPPAPPPPTMMEVLREAAAKAEGQVESSVDIIATFRSRIHELSISAAEKQEFDAIATEAPLKLVPVLKMFKAVKSEQGLQATAKMAIDALDPYIAKLETHKNVTIAAVGIALRAATSALRLMVK